MFHPHIVTFMILMMVLVKGEKEMIFEMEMDWLNSKPVSSGKSNDSSLLCYLKCKCDKKEHIENGSIYLNVINIFSNEKHFILSGPIRNMMLECMTSNLSTETCDPCGENYSRCKPVVSKWSNISNEDSTCCVQESSLEISKLDWNNFIGFPEEVVCLMKCIKARKSIFNERGVAEAGNVFTNTEFVDIKHEKKQTFRRCVVSGTGVHTCEEIIHLYICFFRYMKKAEPREWLYY
ncbi:uncharacterized protein LOC123674616 [Harmonia axyridis]|uniref:uncharacterized protein LOC123674616 n=1 Tax=Harmonia axyridis TaxID=115357 RepID=UPI001E278E75|nr:uncharacterized protein LOC123674616 [Harmonia axyridis]